MAFYDDVSAPKTLCDWVRNFRLKKVQMKRKLRGGGDLRICALLTTALISAEHELRRKQQERFNRWSEVQSHFDRNFTTSASGTYVRTYDENKTATHCALKVEKERKQRDAINNMWKYELKDLDEFMRSISSSGRNSVNVDSTNVISQSSERCFEHNQLNFATHDNTVKVSS